MIRGLGKRESRRTRHCAHTQSDVAVCAYSESLAKRDVATYAAGNRTACFCPLEPNLWAVPERWTIYRFCLFRFSQTDVDRLLYYYHAWFYSGIVALAVSALLMAFPSVVWHRTKCFRRAMRPCRGGQYELVN